MELIRNDNLQRKSEVFRNNLPRVNLSTSKPTWKASVVHPNIPCEKRVIKSLEPICLPTHFQEPRRDTHFRRSVEVSAGWIRDIYCVNNEDYWQLWKTAKRYVSAQWRTEGGVWGVQTPPPTPKFWRYRWSPRSHKQEEPASRFLFVVHCVLIRL